MSPSTTSQPANKQSSRPKPTLYDLLTKKIYPHSLYIPHDIVHRICYFLRGTQHTKTLRQIQSCNKMCYAIATPHIYETFSIRSSRQFGMFFSRVGEDILARKGLDGGGEERGVGNPAVLSSGKMAWSAVGSEEIASFVKTIVMEEMPSVETTTLGKALSRLNEKRIVFPNATELRLTLSVFWKYEGEVYLDSEPEDDEKAVSDQYDLHQKISADFLSIARPTHVYVDSLHRPEGCLQLQLTSGRLRKCSHNEEGWGLQLLTCLLYPWSSVKSITYQNAYFLIPSPHLGVNLNLNYVRCECHRSLFFRNDAPFDLHRVDGNYSLVSRTIVASQIRGLVRALLYAVEDYDDLDHLEKAQQEGLEAIKESVGSETNDAPASIPQFFWTASFDWPIENPRKFEELAANEVKSRFPDQIILPFNSGEDGSTRLACLRVMG